MTTTILIGDALEMLKTLPDESVHCCITSPPYWGLRDYGVTGQMGLEATPEEFLANMVEVFREVRRVLRDDGTCWVNMGDSYNANTGSGFNGQKRYDDANRNTKRQQPANLKPKDLVGIPWRLALALQADGWWLRSDIIWAKPNPMPESVTDRPTKAHEYVFLFSKSARYFYDNDAVREGSTYGENRATFLGGTDRLSKANVVSGGYAPPDKGMNRPATASRNRHTVWTIATQPFSAAHFATFPTKLVEPMIKAGTSEKGCCPECGAPWERVVEKGKLVPDAKGYKPRGKKKEGKYIAVGMTLKGSTQAAPNHHYESTTTGWRPTCDHDHDPIPCTVLDHFAGACTVGLVADRLERDSIMIELNPKYADMGRERIVNDAGWLAEVEVADSKPEQARLI